MCLIPLQDLLRVSTIRGGQTQEPSFEASTLICPLYLPSFLTDWIYSVGLQVSTCYSREIYTLQRGLNTHRVSLWCKFSYLRWKKKKNRDRPFFQIGGGWQDHDLADLTLTWMAVSQESVDLWFANWLDHQGHIGNLLSLDLKYLASLPEPVAPWGHQQPHE
jgi:hypothetical protein